VGTAYGPMNGLPCPGCGKPGAYCFNLEVCLRMREKEQEMKVTNQGAAQCICAPGHCAVEHCRRDGWSEVRLTGPCRREREAYGLASAVTEAEIAGPVGEAWKRTDEEAEAKSAKLPTDAKARKNAPMARGLLDYFPRACAAVAELSRIGNEQHNPGQPMHWAREKSTDHADCIVRHLVDRGTLDSDGQRHSTKVAWRALALLQTELEEEVSEG
jgi:hypothetical protein